MATDGTSNAQEAKKAQRNRMKQTLSTLSDEIVDLQSEKAQNVILDLPQYQQAKRVGIYLSMLKAEAQTGELVRHALDSGKAVFVPYIYSVRDTKPKKKIMDMLRLKSLEDYEGLQRDSWGIPKLPPEGRESRENAMGGSGLSLNSDDVEECDREVAGLDLIVVPAVAFDRDMNRMGHGAGFYDQYLLRFCADKKRAKPFLGWSHCAGREVEIQADARTSRTLPRTAGHRIRPVDHAGMGLESRCYRSRGWDLADFERYPMSIAFQLHCGVFGLLTSVAFSSFSFTCPLISPGVKQQECLMAYCKSFRSGSGGKFGPWSSCTPSCLASSSQALLDEAHVVSLEQDLPCTLSALFSFLRFSRLALTQLPSLTLHILLRLSLAWLLHLDRIIDDKVHELIEASDLALNANAQLLE